MSECLKSKLRAGDQIIATEIAHYTHKGAEGKQSQWVGDLIMVNSTKLPGITCGAGLYDGPGKRKVTERPSLGLGCSLNDGTYRLATPDDPGFMATREQWFACKEKEIKTLRRESFLWAVMGLLALGALALRVIQ